MRLTLRNVKKVLEDNNPKSWNKGLEYKTTADDIQVKGMICGTAIIQLELKFNAYFDSNGWLVVF